MAVISSTLAVDPIAETLRRCQAHRPGRAALERAFARFADDLAWWTEAAKAQQARAKPPY